MAGVTLRFDTPLNTAHPVDLRFGAPLVAIEESNLSLNATLPAPTLSGSLQKVRVVTLATSLPAPTLSAELRYDNAVLRGPGGIVQCAWPGAETQIATAKEQGQQPIRHHANLKHGWDKAAVTPASAGVTMQSSVPLQAHRVSAWLGASSVSASASNHFNALHSLPTHRALPWEKARPVAASSVEHYRNLYRQPRPVPSLQWHASQPVAMRLTARSGVAAPFNPCRDTRWQDTEQPRPGREAVAKPPGKVPCYMPPDGLAVHLRFLDAFSTSPDLRFRCEGSKPITPAAIVVPIRRTYIVINDAHLLRVDGNHTLPTYSLSLNIDMDSWTWGFNASLPASALSLVEPDSAGDPVMLKAMINGASYLLLAESIQRDRAFGTSRISVSGRGRSAMLADPYSSLRTFANSQARTAQQLMADALTINGSSIGWDIDWRITDWLVPAGAWNHQGSTMSAVNAIAAAAGAFIQPDPVNQILRVRPRYPVAPWDWYGTSIAPDLELPAAIISKEGIAWTERPAYNAVYVSGTTTGGILGHVKRAGTAGDVTAPMITDALITHADAARQRGLNVLADTGRIATYTLSLPVLSETGIIDPGTLVRYTDNGNPTVGVVKGVSVTVGLPKVQQTIEVQTHG